MVLEDVLWADDAALDLFRFLGRRLGTTRAFALVTYRRDEVGPPHGERSAEASLDLLGPEALLDEPRPDGSLRLIGTAYLVFQRARRPASAEAGAASVPSPLPPSAASDG